MCNTKCVILFIVHLKKLFSGLAQPHHASDGFFQKKKLIIFWNSKKIFIFACRIAIKN